MFRVIALGVSAGALVAAGMALPQILTATADEPTGPVETVVATVEQLFAPEVIDPRVFRRYAITFDETVSTRVQRTQTIGKIGYGQKSTVSIVKTPSGTYSSDALTSPHVRYPGIDVRTKRHRNDEEVVTGEFEGGRWMSRTRGSFTYFSYEPAAGS